MEDPLSFSDLLLALAPPLAVLWLWGLRQVWRDLDRRSPTGTDVASCGLPPQPLPPSPLQRLLAHRLRAALPRGHLAR